MMKALLLPKITALYHLTHPGNLRAIFQHGILSHNEAYRRHLIRHDVSSPFVQHIREEKHDPIFDRPLHEYASCYFNACNPMLHQLRACHREVVILELTPWLLNSPGTIFTDGNAACEETRFFSTPPELSQLRWDILQADSWNDFRDGKRYRCAEVLVFPKVPADAIRKIHCASVDQCRQVSFNLPIFLPALLEITPALFVA